MGKIKGFTIIELIIVLFIFSIVMLITYTSLTTQSTISKAQEDSLLVSQNVRVSLDVIANYIRMAGFGTKYSLSIQTTQSVNNYNQVFNASDNANLGADTLTVVFANRLVGHVAKNNAGKVQYSGYRIYITSNKINLLDSNKKRYVFFERNPYNQFFQLVSSPANVGSGKYLLTFATTDHIDAYVGDNVYSIRAVTIYYDSDDEQVQLSENTGSTAQTLATDIETIQFQYGIDENGDGVLDDTDNDGNPLDNTVPKNKEKFIKIVKLSVLAKASHPDPTFKDRHSSYYVANLRITLDKNDDNGISSRYDWHFRRKLIQMYISPRNYENDSF